MTEKIIALIIIVVALITQIFLGKKRYRIMFGKVQPAILVDSRVVMADEYQEAVTTLLSLAFGIMCAIMFGAKIAEQIVIGNTDSGALVWADIVVCFSMTVSIAAAFSLIMRLIYEEVARAHKKRLESALKRNKEIIELARRGVSEEESQKKSKMKYKHGRRRRRH